MPLVVLAIVMGVASPAFTRRIEPSVDALVRQVREQTQPVRTATLARPTAAAPPAADAPSTGARPAAGEVAEVRR